MTFSRRALASLLASAAMVVPAHAQEAQTRTAGEPQAAVATPSDRQVFEPAFFARFAPRTALEMVNQVPGFSISGQSGQRGLGQGGANVLLNGTRFSGKSISIFDALGRIPASAVTRIELVDGATLDIPGLSGQVVNVIYRASGGSGQFRWSPQFRSRGTDPTLTNGEVSWTGASGRFDYTVSLENNASDRGNDGPERLLDPAGTLIELREEALRISTERPKVSGTLKYAGPGGDIANLNAALEAMIRRSREGRLTPTATRVFEDGEDEYNYELGGDYAFDLGGGRLKLIGLRRFEASDFLSDLSTVFVDTRPERGSRQEVFIDESEAILRGEFAWKAGANDWQVAAEGALNSLSTANRIEVLDPVTGGYVPQSASPETRVKEQRAEANVTWGRPLSGALSVQASLGGEVSQLSQSGQRGQTRSFVRPKGFVTTAWRASKDLDLRFTVSRRVGQLNFFDFVASTDLNQGNSQAGNPDLVPEQSWDFEIEGTRTLGPWGAITLSAIYRAIEDRVEQVPIGPTGEAPGNIESASSLLLKAVSTVQLEALGWRGAQLDIDVLYNDTSIADPLTGIDRPFSGRTRWSLDADLRQDIPGSDWAYGAGIYAQENDPGVRLDQLSQRSNIGPDGYVFVENKDVAGLRMRATLGNIFNQGDFNSRTVFVDRRDGPAAFTEISDRTFGTIFTFEISGTFG